METNQYQAITEDNKKHYDVDKSLEGDFGAAGIHNIRVIAYIRYGNGRDRMAKRVYELRFPMLSESKMRRLAQLMASNSEFAELLEGEKVNTHE